MRLEVIVWGCIAAGLIAAEVLAPGVFMLWLGIAAALVMVMVWLVPDLGLLVQASVFVVASLALIPAYRHFLGKRHAPSDRPLLNQRGAQLVGQRVPLESAIVAGRGRVKIGDAFWVVTGPDLPAGTRVLVTVVDSMNLTVVADQ